MKKLIDFKDEELVEEIQAHADEFCEGNFNMAVRMLTAMMLSKIKTIGNK